MEPPTTHPIDTAVLGPDWSDRVTRSDYRAIPWALRETDSFLSTQSASPPTIPEQVSGAALRIGGSNNKVSLCSGFER